MLQQKTIWYINFNDGYTAAWERPVWQLYSHSVVLKQISTLNQWFYNAIKPNVHYIDIGREPEKLLTIINQYSYLDLKKIAEAGYDFARD